MTGTAPAGLERLACRFCQHTSLLLYGLADGGVTVLCDDCHAQGPRADTDAEAIAAYTRAPAEPTEPSRARGLTMAEIADARAQHDGERE